jgi:hypothetical protein
MRNGFHLDGLGGKKSVAWLAESPGKAMRRVAGRTQSLSAKLTRRWFICRMDLRTRQALYDWLVTGPE